MSYCKTCRHRNQDGWCMHQKIAERTSDNFSADAMDMLIYDYCEGGGFWVGPDFGCVHHDARNDTRGDLT